MERTRAEAAPDADAALAADLRIIVGRLARRLRQLQPGGLTPSQLSALSSIERLGPIRLGDLAAAEGIAGPTLTKIVGILEGEGLVGRTPDATDRRAARVAITPSGRSRLKSIYRERNAFLQQRLESLTADERARLRTTLPLLASLAEETGR
jgi:DNA-binding MarR family transcriptional regulator